MHPSAVVGMVSSLCCPAQITRESIDLLKENFKDDVSEEQWKLIISMKKVFNIGGVGSSSS